MTSNQQPSPLPSEHQKQLSEQTNIQTVHQTDHRLNHDEDEDEESNDQEPSNDFYPQPQPHQSSSSLTSQNNSSSSNINLNYDNANQGMVQILKAMQFSQSSSSSQLPSQPNTTTPLINSSVTISSSNDPDQVQTDQTSQTHHQLSNPPSPSKHFTQSSPHIPIESSIYAIHRSYSRQLFDENPQSHSKPHSPSSPQHSDQDEHIDSTPSSVDLNHPSNLDPHALSTQPDSTSPIAQHEQHQPQRGLSPQSSSYHNRHILSSHLDPTASSLTLRHPPQAASGSGMSNSVIPIPSSSYTHRPTRSKRKLTDEERKTLLASKLKEIFNLPTNEDVLGEYPCWLFRSVLLKGYLYLTTRYLCFYAYLKRTEEEEIEGKIVKAGTLAKRNSSKFTHRYSKHWYILKDSILSWYPSSYEPYFPTGQLDLHYCTAIESRASNAKNPHQFRLVVSNKAYTFSTDSQQSQQEWIKLLKKVVFTCQHSGENVKISIPLETIEEVERCQSLQFVETIRIKTREWIERRDSTINNSQPPSQPSPDSLTTTTPSDAMGSNISDAIAVPDDYFFAFAEDLLTPLNQIQGVIAQFRNPTSSVSIPHPGPQPDQLQPGAIQTSLNGSAATTPCSDSFISPPSSGDPTSLPRLVQDSTRAVAHNPTEYPPRRSSSTARAPHRDSTIQDHSPSPSRTRHSLIDPKTISSSITQRIRNISSTSNKLVGSPIRSTSIKVRKLQAHARRTPVDPLVDQFNETSDQNLSGLSHISPDKGETLSTTPVDTSSSTDEQETNQSAPLDQSYIYPPGSHRRHSAHSPNRFTTSPKYAGAQPLKSDGQTADSSNPSSSWGIFPGWLKAVPSITKPAKDIHWKAVAAAKNILIAPLSGSGTNKVDERGAEGEKKLRPHCNSVSSRVSITVTNPNQSSAKDESKANDLQKSMVLVEPMSSSCELKSGSKVDNDDGIPDNPRGISLITAKDEKKFQKIFNFSNPVQTEGDNQHVVKLSLKTNCYLFRGLPIYGKLYIGKPAVMNARNYRKACICFKGQKPISNSMTKMILPLVEILQIRLKKGFRFGYHGLVIIVKNGKDEEIFLEFSNETHQSLVLEEMNLLIKEIKTVEADSINQIEKGNEDETKNNKDELGSVFRNDLDDEEDDDDDDDDGGESEDSDNMNLVSGELEEKGSPERVSRRKSMKKKTEPITPIMFQSTTSEFLNFKPNRTLHITCLTIGSRGDVQPYIALCNELAKDGHRTRIASHGEYKDWIEGYGIEFVEIGGDPAELMKICVDNGMFTLSFLKEGLTKFRGWLDDLLASAFEACQGTDLLIESPSAMAGIHIAEALGIPYFRAFTMPWTRTRTYPHAFAVPDHRMGGGYNYMTYTVFDQVFWRAISGQVNRWRKEKLGIRSTTFDKMECHKVPFLYNFSPSIVPMPIDWFEWVHITGYWFLDEGGEGEDDQKIDAELIKFLKRSREMGKKIVYIGFGSIVVPDPVGLSKMVIEAVEKSGVHAVVSKGWSDRMTKKDSHQENDKTNEDDELINESEHIFNLQSVPHDWLFPKIDAVCHHGGAGTTGASLRAGVPTIIRPFFGDQFFWADRVEKLGIGIGLKKMNVKSLCKALEIGTKDEVMIKKAKMIGELIRAESGVSKAVESIYRDLEYAKSLIKKNKTRELGEEEEVEEDQEEEENPMESSDQCEIEESGSGENEESQLDGCEALEGDDEEDAEEEEVEEGEEEDNSSWDHLSQPSMSPFFGPLT